MPMRSTFEISTQIILLKIDGFFKGWILNITPLKALNLTYHQSLMIALNLVGVIGVSYLPPINQIDVDYQNLYKEYRILPCFQFLLVGK